MTQLSALPLCISAEQVAQLESVVRKHSSPQQLVKRANIILHAHQGIGVNASARLLNDTRARVQMWRKRWRESESDCATERLRDSPRPGKPPIYSPEQVCAIVAIACERPEDSARPISHWTQKEIADEAVKRGVAEKVSPRAVGHFLKKCRP